MATTTPNLGLTLPAGTERVSRTTVNANNTLIDAAIGEDRERLESLETDTAKLMEIKAVGTIENAHGSSHCVQIGNLVWCDIRYDYATNAQLFTNMPKAKYLARNSVIANGDATRRGVIQIDEGATVLQYIQGSGGDAARYGQLIYIADE